LGGGRERQREFVIDTNVIEQDKHAKNLAEKLAARLDRCESERQWNDTAYALSLLQHKNEDIAKKVQEGYRVVGTAAA
jgi:condensin complex subunit 1